MNAEYQAMSTAERKAKVLELLRSGLLLVEVTEATGIHCTSIRDWRRDAEFAREYRAVMDSPDYHLKIANKRAVEKLKRKEAFESEKKNIGERPLTQIQIHCQALKYDRLVDVARTMHLPRQVVYERLGCGEKKLARYRQNVKQSEDAFIKAELLKSVAATETMEAPNEQTGGFVYFIQNIDTGLVKIGVATNIKSRLDNHKVCVRFKVLKIVPGYTALERAFHNKFEAYRVFGEWFRPEHELLAFINNLKLEDVPKYSHRKERPSKPTYQERLALQKQRYKADPEFRERLKRTARERYRKEREQIAEDLPLFKDINPWYVLGYKTQRA